MPKAMVATITMPSSRWKRACRSARVAASRPGVVGEGRDALGLQPLGRLVHALARQAVDDARLARVRLADEGEQLRPCVALVGDACSGCSGGRSSTTNTRALLEREPLDDLLAGLRIGGGRERDARHRRVALVQHGEQQVVRPEVVAPLRDAVRLVDGEERDARLVEQLEAARRAEPLGRDVRAGRARPRAARARRRGPWRHRASSSGTRRGCRAAQSAATWSCISAISGETTTAVPGRSSAGSW